LSARLRLEGQLLPAIALVVVICGVFASGSATFVQSATYAGIYAIAAIGLSILLGNANQISIGQAAFFGIGAYTVAALTTTWSLPAGLSWLLAALVGVALAALVGLGLGFIALRFRGHYLAMATLAFGLIFVGVLHETKALGGVTGIQNVPYAQVGPLVLVGPVAYWFAWAIALLVALLSLNLLRGRTGRAFETIRNDELAAEVGGVPTRRYKIFAFSYAGALAGLGGALYAPFLGIVVPDAFGVPLSVDFLLMVVLGGSGGVSGAIAGAALTGFLDVSGHQFENWRQVAYGILVIAVVIAAPRGLIGFVRPRRPVPQAERARVQPRMPAQAPVSGAPLEIQGATKRFGGLLAVDNVSFALQPGSLTSLIGPNGAGKTTLFNAICGVGRLTAGSVRVAGSDVTGWLPHRIAALGLGRTFQNARLFGEMTVLENVVAGAFRTERSSFGGDLFALPGARRAERDARERGHAMLERLGLGSLASSLAKDLAFGDRRRVELARAIAANPWLLLVDEPAAGLNAAERARLHDDLLALRDTGMTLLLIEHDMRLVMTISERVMVLKFGALIADGTPAAVRENPDVVAAYLGTSR